MAKQRVSKRRKVKSVAGKVKEETIIAADPETKEEILEAEMGYTRIEAKVKPTAKVKPRAKAKPKAEVEPIHVEARSDRVVLRFIGKTPVEAKGPDQQRKRFDPGQYYEWPRELGEKLALHQAHLWEMPEQESKR